MNFGHSETECLWHFNVLLSLATIATTTTITTTAAAAAATAATATATAAAPPYQCQIKFEGMDCRETN
jgi:hypothetical protein